MAGTGLGVIDLATLEYIEEAGLGVRDQAALEYIDDPEVFEHVTGEYFRVPESTEGSGLSEHGAGARSFCLLLVRRPP